MPLRLELRHYETVVAIVAAGTMTAAANRLALSQSALSHRLAEAERRLGQPLFARGSDRRLSPTPAGLVVQQAGLRVLHDLRRVEAGLLSGPQDATTSIRLGVAAYRCFDWFPSFQAAMAVATPHIGLTLTALGDEPGAALARREVDVVLAPGHPEGHVERRRAFTDELVLVCAPDHPLATHDRVEARDLERETYLTYNPRPSPGFEFERFVRSAGTSPRLVSVVPETSSIIELVAAGAGVSILSRWAVDAAVTAGRLRALRCGVDGLPIDWHCLSRDGDGAAAEIADHLTAHLDPGRTETLS